jgi:hypothetical protein
VRRILLLSANYINIFNVFVIMYHQKQRSILPTYFLEEIVSQSIIRTGALNTLPCEHVPPINLVVYQGS